MSVVMNRKDYSIVGTEKENAQQKGLVAADWYTCPIPRKRLKQLMKRKNGPAIRDTIIWFGALIGAGILAYHTRDTWWAIATFLLYGMIYATPADSRWHECSHGTPFKTLWMNEVVYQTASFMCLKPATPWRWSHSRHHTDTIIIGRDPEIVAPRPPIWRILLLDIIHLNGGMQTLKRVLLHFFGRLDKEEKEYIPKTAHSKTFWEARIWILIFAGLIAWCIHLGSLLPLLFIGLPTFYGKLINLIFEMTQHLGLCENVLDHRLNSRTIYMGPIFRFLYWNMNYHIEHHMFPMVPYHALPALHEEIKHDCPPACRNTWEAIKEVITALWMQRKDPVYTVVKPLPNTANPYWYGVYAVGKLPEEAGSDIDPEWFDRSKNQTMHNI